MRPGSNRRLLALALGALLLGGCGEPRTVTIVDPNPPDSANGAVSSMPFERFGVAAAERAKAIVRLRGALAVARTLGVSDPDGARDAVDSTITNDLPVIEPRLTSSDPALARSVRIGLERLRDTPPAAAAGYNREVRRLADVVLRRVEDVVIEPAARQDIAFRGAILSETLVAAAMAYEASFEGDDDEITDVEQYRAAYGQLIDASTRQLEAVPDSTRSGVRSRLDTITRRATPGPTPPGDPRNPETVLSELSGLAEDVAIASGIDTAFPPPDPSTPDQLRALKRGVAAAVEAAERGEQAEALQQLVTAQRSSLALASNGVAAVDPSRLFELERGVAMTLPDAIRANADVASAGADLDARIDDAITVVEEELELLREG
ncbi:MAG: hypothetical protein JWM86_877 [Thermoleophilia bacterium]|nr:hypothetical protein [Thermoleophilia bacterium]